jgi:hypothetical protein
MSSFFEGRGNCPKCGKFCSDIRAKGNEIKGLFEVTGKCKTHGKVDLTDQAWSWDDFFND